eukprot:11556390-Alexandrium_andersonii.AAC.1
MNADWTGCLATRRRGARPITHWSSTRRMVILRPGEVEVAGAAKDASKGRQHSACRVGPWRL